MRELQDSQHATRDRLMLDFTVQGYNENFFKTTTGTPAASGGKLRLTSAGVASYSNFTYGDYTFALNIPTTPSAGEAKTIGLRNPASNRGALYFEITGATFQAVSLDDNGVSETTAITWNSRSQTWENVVTLFRMVWTPQYVDFFVTPASAIAAMEPRYVRHATRVGTIPQSLRVLNSDADNVDIDYILAHKVGIQHT